MENNGKPSQAQIHTTNLTYEKLEELMNVMNTTYFLGTFAKMKLQKYRSCVNKLALYRNPPSIAFAGVFRRIRENPC